MYDFFRVTEKQKLLTIFKHFLKALVNTRRRRRCGRCVSPFLVRLFDSSSSVSPRKRVNLLVMLLTQISLRALTARFVPSLRSKQGGRNGRHIVRHCAKYAAHKLLELWDPSLR